MDSLTEPPEEELIFFTRPIFRFFVFTLPPEAADKEASKVSPANLILPPELADAVVSFAARPVNLMSLPEEDLTFSFPMVQPSTLAPDPEDTET